MGAYNHDLLLDEDSVEKFPHIKNILCDPVLQAEFTVHDKRAKRAKGWFHGLGVAALVLGIVGLLLALAEVSSPALHLAVWPKWMRLVGPCSALMAIFIYFTSQLLRLREKWLASLFARERIRQWHFQRFLDGKTVSQLGEAGERHLAQAELQRRWALFRDSLNRDPGGAMDAYVKRKEDFPKWDHPQTDYRPGSVADEVFTALSDLRLEHQVQYSVKKTLPSGHEITLPPNERDRISEWLARSTFIAAIALAALQVLLYSYLASTERSSHAAKLEELGVGLNVLAVLFAILSAGIRVYRIGYTLPGESESYQHYLERCEIFLRSWDHTAFDKQSKTLDTTELLNLEIEAYRELRHFLTIKRTASFLF